MSSVEKRDLDAGDVTAILKAAESSRYYPALVLIASTGLRKGECLALRWDSDVLNLDEGWLKVRRTLGRIGDRLVISEPKTDRARRTMPLSPAVVTMLRKHRAAQAAEKLRASNQWQDSGLVFTTDLGGPVDPRNLLRVVETAAAAAGVEGVDVHTLRHSAAVAWLESGCTSKRWLICSGIRRSRLQATSTDTPAMRPHGPRSTAYRARSGYESPLRV